MPTPKKCVQTRLAMFFAKYAFFALVSQSASSRRGERSGAQLGLLPSKKVAVIFLSVPGMTIVLRSDCGWRGPTKPGRAAKQARLDAKKRLSEKKRERRWQGD